MPSSPCKMYTRWTILSAPCNIIPHSHAIERRAQEVKFLGGIDEKFGFFFFFICVAWIKECPFRYGATRL